MQLRIVHGVDTNVETMVNEVRSQTGLPVGEEAREDDERLEEHLSETRLAKDAFELEEMVRAVEVIKAGFENIIRILPRAVGHRRDERVIEGTFRAVARGESNGRDYEAVAASGNHASTLHWIDNDGEVCEDDLVLVDASVGVDSLYTADITRTLPVSGRFTKIQARIYQAILDTCEAALARANGPGCHFEDVHDVTMRIITTRLHEWGILPVIPKESLASKGQQHRHWIPRGISRHLGLDVHDCAKARGELYRGTLLESGMVFTVEPDLYFRADGLLIPEEYRGIGVRIEDDVAVNVDDAIMRISEDIPYTIANIKEWITRVQSR